MQSHRCFFFFNDTATTEIYTLSLHDALPIFARVADRDFLKNGVLAKVGEDGLRSEEHTSELQSRLHLVCRLLLEKKKTPLRTSALQSPTQPPTRGAVCSPMLPS